MTKHLTVDVLVAGARCAGAVTAMLLARAGLRVLCIDRGGYGSDTLSTHALMRGGVMQLARWGVLDQIKELGTPAIRTTSFSYGDRMIEIPIQPSHGVDALYAPRRTVLDSLLVDAAQEAGADVRHHHTLTALRRDGDGRVRGAAVLDEDGDLLEVTADLVIGADGINSAVARLTEARTLAVGEHACAVVYGYWSDIPDDANRWYFRPGVSAGLIPTTGGHHCVFAAMPPERLRAGIRQGLDVVHRDVVREVSPTLAEMVAGGQLNGSLRPFAGRKGFLRQASGAGWALVGDAGYFKDPLTAHGITDALRDADLLARAVIGDAMETYGAARDALSLPLFTVTDAIASFAWDLATLQDHHKALNTAMKREVEHMAALHAEPAGALG